jgi:lipopolysaccharide/colanic/teichoic acid biosynthesis glycosyltransferase
MRMMRAHRPGRQPPFMNSVFNWCSDDTSLLLKGLSGILTTMTKRAFDLVLSVFGLVLLAPLLVAVSVMIKVESAGPVFYRGLRMGRGGKSFRIFKFRTMAEDAEKLGGASTPEDDPRVTGVGRFLRRYKLDELPQILNVITGEMSLVGPRPQVPWAVELYTREERAVLSARPGITDYASVRFRDEGEILRGSANPDKDYFEKIHPEKMRLSLEYVRKQSLWLDCQILWKTLGAVVLRPARAESGHRIDGGPSSRTVLK